jgi:diguanylate cyclase (GGDEF)-like protein
MGPIERMEFDGRANPDSVADELERLLATDAVKGVPRLEAVFLLGAVRSRLNQPAAAEAAAQVLLKSGVTAFAAVSREHLAAAAACIRAGVVVAEGGSLVRADAMLTEVEAALRGVASLLVRARCMDTQANIKQNLGQAEDSVRLFQEVIRLADESGLAWRRSSARSGLSYALFRAGQLDHAWRLSDEAKKIATEDEDWFGLSVVATTEAILLTDTGKTEQELAALTDAIDHARRAGATRDEALGLANLSDFYLHQADYARAYQIAQRALPLARSQRQVSTENLAKLNSGLALISMRRMDEGMALIKPVLEHDRASNDLASLKEATADVARYLEKAGYQAEAFTTFQSLRGLTTELARRDQQAAVLELQEGFDAQQRRRELALLNEDNALKEEQLRRRDLEYKVWALTAVIVLFLLALAARMYRGLRATQMALRQRNAQLKRHSLQDPLTGLANRRQFHEMTEADGAHGPARGTLYLLDLDHFKTINDRHGHAAGDAVLVEVARRLTTVLRDEDLVVRWGGEEFLVLVPGMSAERVEPLAQRLLNAVASMPVILGEQRLDVTTSIGFAEFPLLPQCLDMPWDMAVDIVDNAMYVAKTLGRNRACGIGAVPAGTLAEVDLLTQDLERSWREGRVQMKVLQGPAVQGAMS